MKEMGERAPRDAVKAVKDFLAARDPEHVKAP
jgi:hypothetical protein